MKTPGNYVRGQPTKCYWAISLTSLEFRPKLKTKKHCSEDWKELLVKCPGASAEHFLHIKLNQVYQENVNSFKKKCACYSNTSLWYLLTLKFRYDWSFGYHMICTRPLTSSSFSGSVMVFPMMTSEPLTLMPGEMMPSSSSLS